MNTAEITARVLALPGMPKGATVTVEATDPATHPNLAKFQAASIYVIGPRRACWYGFIRHDGTLGGFVRA